MSAIEIPSGAASIVAAEVAAWGGRDAETGGFLLCRREEARVEKVALSGAHGIKRRRDQFMVSGRAMGLLFAYAEENDLAVRAQFHSHGREAFLSEADLTHGFSVEGFITTVVPHFAAPPAQPKSWRWWVYLHRWNEIPAPVVMPGGAEIVRFDEEGARET